jgi:GNAT superfamily N-acetyltransferase
MATVDVRLATVADVPALTRTLARAFDDDPVTGHLLPPSIRRRTDRLARFMSLGTRTAVGDSTVYTNDELSGAAVWRRPGRWRLPTRDLMGDGPALARTLGRRLPLAISCLRAIEARHPEEPHWYLEILGTDPPSQGRGVGRSLMAPVLDRCDREELPAYLESSKERNVPYYERHGFRVREEMRLPRGGPPLWLMWREPQSA